MFDGPAGSFAPSGRLTDEAGVSWIPSTVVLVTPSGDELRYERTGWLLPARLSPAGVIIPPHFAHGSHFRVGPSYELGALSIIAEVPPLSYLDDGVPNGANSVNEERTWAANWVREIISRVPLGSVRSDTPTFRRRAAVLIALTALIYAGRNAGRAIRATFRHSASPLREWLHL